MGQCFSIPSASEDNDTSESNTATTTTTTSASKTNEASKTADKSSQITMLYFPIAGRGELIRLIAAAGGVDLKVEMHEDWKKRSIDAGFFGSLPVLTHGDFKLCQSAACERYIANIAPKFKDLTAKQRAVDNMYAMTKEDIVAGCAKVMFGDDKIKAEAKTTVPALLDKFLGPLEKMVPDKGFVNGLAYPTVADLALLNVVTMMTPVGVVIKMAGGYDFKKFPKIMAIVEKTKSFAGVKEYVATSNSMMGTFPDAPAASKTDDEPSELTMLYFPIAGRGELIRLIAAAGGVDLKVEMHEDWKKRSIDAGFFGSLPVLTHGDFKLCQSAACERYIANIAPKFKDLSPQVRAVDNMYAMTKEDIVAGCAKVMFGDDKIKAEAKTTVPALLDKFLGPLEKMVPDKGFVNGLAYPTVADLALLNVVTMMTPVGVVIKMAGGYDFKKFPKIMAIADATRNFPGVKEYMETTKSMMGTFPDAPAASKTDDEPSEPTMLYFPIAGRGELIRLIAAAGGVDLKVEMHEDWKKRSIDAGFFGSLPVLTHGDFKLCQSAACERYIANIAPQFKNLSPQVRAVDNMYAMTKEDIVAGCAKVMFGDDKIKAEAKTTVPALLDKFLGPLEKMVPDKGFVNGLAYPTVADLALLNVVTMMTPVGVVIKMAGGYDFKKFPKIMAIADATRNFPGVKEYMETTKSMMGTF